MDIESLLFRAASEPLGPFSMSYEAASPETWALTVTLDGQTRRILAEPEPRTGGLVLSCPVDAGTVSGPWLSTVSPTPDGKQERRIWLHGDGLSTALLVGALAELTRAAAPDKPEPKPLLEPVHIPIPTPPPTPDPVPVERPRPLDWQTFSPAPVSAPATEPVTSASEQAVGTPAEETHSIEPVAAVPVTISPEPQPVASMLDQGQPASRPAEVVAVSPEVTSEPPATPETKDIEGASSPSPTREQPQASPDVPKVAGKAGNCFECGSPYAADHAFCTNCGARLIAAGSN